MTVAAVVTGVGAVPHGGLLMALSAPALEVNRSAWQLKGMEILVGEFVIRTNSYKNKRSIVYTHSTEFKWINLLLLRNKSQTAKPMTAILTNLRKCLCNNLLLENLNHHFLMRKVFLKKQPAVFLFLHECKVGHVVVNIYYNHIYKNASISYWQTSVVFEIVSCILFLVIQTIIKRKWK